MAGSKARRRSVAGSSREALALGAEYIDVEWRAGFDDVIALTGGRRIVLSMHDYTGMPDDLGDSARAMRATGAQVIKIAGTANSLSDCIRLLDIGTIHGKQGGMVLIAMGEQGLASRVLAGRFESSWTYAGAVSSVGQLGAATMLEEYRFRSVTESTDIYGVVGSPVAHSVSPAMHNAAFRAARLDAVYLPLLAVDVGDFDAFARAFGLKGASVTIPFKVALCEHVDEAYSVARRIGAINTIRMVDGRWVGGNTDASGFLRPLQDRYVALRGMRAAILGAGGGARAVAIALASSGVEVRVHARDRARAAQVAMIVSGDAGPWPPEPGSWDLLVNCTPIGMHPEPDRTPVEAGAPDRAPGLRPRVQPQDDPPAARGEGRGLPDHWRSRDARRPGARAVPVVDGRPTAGRRHAGGRGAASRGVCDR